MKTMNGLVLAAAACFLAACEQSPVDLKGEKAALLAAAERYHETSHASQWVKLTESETRDVLILPPNGASVHGVEAARQLFESTPTDFEIHYEAPVVEVSRSGDMGFSLANATVRSTTPDGSTVESRIRDFHLWKKQGGEWKIAIDMWNQALPIATPQ